jgi:tetratricopeptide (TPR) repeat protein
VPHLKRLLSATLLVAATALVPVGPVAAAIIYDNGKTATGGYLAGQEALSDLRTAEAAEYFGQAIAVEPENVLLLDRAFFAQAADGRIGAATSTAKRLLALDPDNEMARLLLATDAVRAGRFKAAVAELEKLGTDTFGGITGSILRAWALIGDNRVDEGIAVVDELGTEGLEEFLVFHKALMLDVAGRKDEAIEAAERAYQADPRVAWVAEAYARMLGNAGRYDEAVRVLDEYAASGLTHPLVDAVRTPVTAGEAPGPFVTTIEAGASQMFHGVGMALARDGGLEIAMMFLQLARHLNPDADFIPLSIGQLLDASEHYEAANAIYGTVAKESPMYGVASVRIAQNLDSLGAHDEAIRRLREISTVNPNDLDAISILGDILRTQERYAEAIDAYGQALAITGGDNLSDWRFYYVRGISYERSRIWDKAEADFLRALELNPDHPQVLNYLGYSWVDQGMHLQEALAMIEKAVDAAPRDGYIIDSLGWAFYRLGRFDEAVEVLEQAVRILPNDPEINDHLGDAYWRVGRKLEARFQWNVASYVDKEGNVRERVAPKLAGGLDSVPVSPDSAPIPDPAAATQAQVSP